MERPLLSIIIPVYNVESYLRRCLDSAIKQDYPNKEIIIVDDGSTDSSLEICREYAATYENITLIHKENGGLSSARNTALDVVKGEYMTFLDSDDYLVEGILAKAIKKMEEHSAQMVAYKVGYSTDGETYVDYQYTKEPYVLVSQENLICELATERGVGVCVIVCNKVFRAEVWKDLRFREGVLFEDLDVIYEVFRKVDTCVYMNEFGYVQYVRPGSIVQSGFEPKKMYILEIIERIKKRLTREYGDTHEYICAIDVKAAEKSWWLYTLAAKNPEKYRDEMKRLLEITEEKLASSTPFKWKYWRRYFRIWYYCKKEAIKYASKTGSQK